MKYLTKLSEVILKGKNRTFFERILQQNIKAKLQSQLVSF